MHVNIQHKNMYVNIHRHGSSHCQATGSAALESTPRKVDPGKIKCIFLLFILEFRLELELELGLKLE